MTGGIPGMTGTAGSVVVGGTVVVGIVVVASVDDVAAFTVDVDVSIVEDACVAAVLVEAVESESPLGA